MKKSLLLAVARRAVPLFVFSLASLGQAQPQTVRYQIIAGSYVVEGGPGGPSTNALPNAQQAFLEVTTGLSGVGASVRILGSDATTEALTLVNGALVSGQYQFSYVTNAPNYPANPNPAQVDYALTLGTSPISLVGSLQTAPSAPDLPYAFTHYAVLAVPLPDLFTWLLPPGNFGISTNRLLAGDVLGVRWQGYGSSSYCPGTNPPCAERFGPAYGPWQDAVFLYRGTTYRLLGTAAYSGWLPPGGGYELQGSFTLPADLPPGDYGIEVRIDYRPGQPDGLVPELDPVNVTVQVLRRSVG